MQVKQRLNLAQSALKEPRKDREDGFNRPLNAASLV